MTDPALDPTSDPDIDTSPLPPELTDDTAAPPEAPATPIVDEDDDTELDDPDTEDDADEALEADVVDADNDEQGIG
jgi:hypothetical protein